MFESEDAWEKSRELVREGEPYWNLEHPQMGMFKVVYQSDQSFAFAKGERGAETYLHFGTGCLKSANNYLDLTVWTPGGIYTLYDDEVQFEDLLSRTRAQPNVPNFTFKWKNKLNNWEVEGQLKFARVDLQGAYTDFHIGPDGSMHANRQDSKGILNGLPMDLNELARTFHHSLDWQIDYQQRSQQILQVSNLEEFVKACKETPKD